ncbi:MAG TPA: ABC transporter permease subunit [Anaerolineaceae bacterium]
MDLHRIRTIIDKEWAEVFKNRMVIVTLAVLPVVFTLLPLVILYAMHTSGGLPSGVNAGADVPANFQALCGGQPAGDCMQIYIMTEFLMMFMMMPLIMPTAFAAYSIVGEKTTRSLEPLLATPITTPELLAGKSLAAVIPAIALSWLSFGVFLLCLPLVGATPGLIRYTTGPVWLLAVLVIGPLLAIASVNLAVIVSSRVNDPRAAEQIAGVLIVPVLLVLFGQLAGLFILNAALMSVAIVVLLLVDVALIYAGAQLFQRETILTRWK